MIFGQRDETRKVSIYLALSQNLLECNETKGESIIEILMSWKFISKIFCLGFRYDALLGNDTESILPNSKVILLNPWIFPQLEILY